jgi:hypothetical protein
LLCHGQNKVAALRLLHRFGSYCDDEARLQRLVPYVMSLLEDPSVNVKVGRALGAKLLYSSWLQRTKTVWMPHLVCRTKSFDVKGYSGLCPT